LTSIAFLLAATLAAGALAEPGADEHLLAGARAFRAGQFAEALVQFRVADKLGHSGEAPWYAAAALVKLKRPEEAVEAFADAEKRAPRVRDDLFDYYRAVACNDARLYLCADKLLASVGERAGPRIREEAQKLRAGIEAILAPEPSKGAIDWYHARAAGAAKGGRGVLAQAHLEEAAGLSARRKDRYRAEETALARTRQGVPARSEPK
jgi:hypothetical protein